MAERWPQVIAMVIVSALAFVLGAAGLCALVVEEWRHERDAVAANARRSAAAPHGSTVAERGYAPHGSKVAAPFQWDVERPDDGGYRHVSPVVNLDSRRRVPCPHCDDTFTVANLDGHLRFTCRVLAAKRAHPSSRTPGA